VSDLFVGRINILVGGAALRMRFLKPGLAAWPGIAHNPGFKIPHCAEMMRLQDIHGIDRMSEGGGSQPWAETSLRPWCQSLFQRKGVCGSLPDLDRLTGS